MAMTLNYLRDFATRYAAAWCSGNPEAVAAFFSPNGSLRINDGPPSVGRPALTEAVHSFMSTFPDMRVSFDDLKQSGPRFEFHWTLVGANTGPGGSGNKVRISGFESWFFSPDGLIEDSVGHFDAADYQRQLDGGLQA
jgi:hypothetical protein